ncbi:hypothetical protein VUJ46_04855 [Chryseobacterium sp. MYb264]|nr:hypothetical protein VUJ46_04855 [Chryseobacterium sp. MYb264]
MKNQNLQKDKKLNKKELKTIKGRLQMCWDAFTGECTSYGRQCAEAQCK